jgi:hypothetical protein
MIIVEDTGPPDAPIKKAKYKLVGQARANHGNNSPVVFE